MSTVDKAVLIVCAAVIVFEVVYGLLGGYPVETMAAFVSATVLGIALGFVMARL